MDQERIIELIEKVYSGTASPAEIGELDTLYARFDSKPDYTETLDRQDRDKQKELIYSEILSGISAGSERRANHTFKYKAIMSICAAAALILIGFSIQYLGRSGTDPKQQGRQMADIRPGSNSAILTLSNGKTISLTDAKNGELANENEASVRKTADGKIIYSKEANAERSIPVYNTMTTPRGGQYTVTLSDGTLVTMNSASSLKYPVCFSKEERVVELIGEAYFQVAHNKSKPFKVITNEQTVEVLGTHFNINGYGDDNAIKTVLEEGSVKVHSKSGYKLLKPGQQSIFKDDHMEVSEADVEETLSWKNGYFRFNNESIKSIMPKLARWYNIEFTFSEKVSDVGFYGTISRTKNISEVLRMLEITKDVHFKIEGRRILVMP